jgi:hypothetical protein
MCVYHVTSVHSIVGMYTCLSKHRGQAVYNVRLAYNGVTFCLRKCIDQKDSTQNLYTNVNVHLRTLIVSDDD